MLKRISLFACALCLLLGLARVGAQDNLLKDGDFEGNYTGRSVPEGGDINPGQLNVPGAWALWITQQPRTQSWQNRVPTIFPHNGPNPNPHGGGRALNITRDGATFTVALYQQVSIAQGTKVQASAWAYLKTCRPNKGGTDCSSDASSGAFVKVGIDPTGGVDPTSGNIAWSGPATPHNTWQQVTVDATAAGGTITVFLYATQNFPATSGNDNNSTASFNRVYWDDAALSTGGSGGAPAPGAPTVAPTAPPVVAFVVPQQAQSDGSIVHTVQPGDTIDSIAFAYGVTRAQILELNKISDPRIISVGQKLIVKQAVPGGAATEAAAPASTEAAPAGDTAQPTPQSDSSQSPTAEAPQTTEAAAPQPTEQSTEVAAAPTVENSQPSSAASAEPAPVVKAAQAGGSLANTASVCVQMFNDANQNRIQEPNEQYLAGGKINLKSGSSDAGSGDTTDKPDPICFNDLTAGDYVAAAGAPSGYGLTTPDQLKLQLYPGAKINIAFGAAQGVQPIQPPPADAGAAPQSVSNQDTSTQQTTILDKVLPYSGLIVFGLAAVVLIGGVGAALLLRRR